MIDADLRELERTAKADPTNAAAKERLEDARVRLGLGWHGETLHPRLSPLVNERGLYVYELPVEPGTDGKPIPRVFTEMVYVSGHEEECKHGTLRQHAELWASTGVVCSECGGSSKVATPSFYLGRFPVTNAEQIAHLRTVRGDHGASFDWLTGGAKNDRNPVTIVSIYDARAFCAWSGLRLPTSDEWEWAAIHDGEDRVPYGQYEDCLRPRDHAPDYCLARRFFPWGNSPPSDERCVSAIMFDRGDENLRTRPAPARTMPVVVLEGQQVIRRPAGSPILVSQIENRLVPARPLGASWCGVHDMAGNVKEWVTCGERGFDRLGGSFGSTIVAGVWPREVDHRGLITDGQADYEIGFRVALSVPA